MYVYNTKVRIDASIDYNRPSLAIEIEELKNISWCQKMECEIKVYY
jgi:hypothetical protein